LYMIAKLGILALIGLLVIGMAGCVEEKNDITSKPESTPTEISTSKYKIECSAFAEDRIAYLKIRVEGEAKNLKVILGDPEGYTTDAENITRDDLLDGIETVKVAMSSATSIYWDIPKAGTYTLVIKESSSGEIVYSTKLTFSGAKIRIINREFTYGYYESSFYYDLMELKLQITNEGDLPAFFDEIVIVIGDKEYNFLHYEGISPKESKEIIEKTHISNLESGTHPVTIKLYSKKTELASYETQLTLRRKA